MRILVTGGLGSIGCPLVEELRSRKRDVVSLDIRHGDDERGFSLRTDVARPTYVRCDVGQFRQLQRVIEECGPFDYVYHCAAEFGRWNGEDFYELLWQSNAIGTKNVIRLQEKHGFRLVHFSSSEVYGDWPDVMVETVLDENPIHQMNDYAMSKLVNEMQIHNSAQQFGTESVIVRLFNTYGPGEYYSPYRSVNCRFLYCGLKALPWIVFRGHTRTSTFVADTVRTLANISEGFRPGQTYNIGGLRQHSVEELSDLVLKITGASESLVEYREPEQLTTRDKKVDVSKAVSDLDHKVTIDLEEGLERTACWMRKVYALPRAAQATG